MLEWLHNQKNATGILARWALGLLEYNYKTEYQKGSIIIVQHALSRKNKTITLNSDASLEGKIVEFRVEKNEWYNTRIRLVRKNPENNQTLANQG